MSTRTWLRILCLVVLLVQFLQVNPPTPPVIPQPPIVIPPIDPPVVPPVIPPVVPPVEQGKRTVAILYETEEVTDDFTRTTIELRDPNKPYDQYLRSKGHTMYILDDDTADADGDLSDFVAALLPLNSQLPCIYIMDSSDGRPLANKTITFDTTAEQIMAFIKANGG